MSQGNSRTNGIPDRKSNASPNCEHHRDIGHKLSSPSCTCTLPGGITVVQFYASPDGVQFPAERRPSTASRVTFLLRTCSVSAKISSDDTRPFRITLRVIMMICKSTHNDALRTYHSSSFSFSSLVTSLAPFTCAHPLMPGRTDSLMDLFEG